MTAPLFYLDRVSPGQATIGGDEARHAAGSMRIRQGERVEVCDGAGVVGHGRVVDVRGRGEVVVQIDSVERRPTPREVCVVQGLPKGDHADLAVDLLTQTGVSRIVPWASQRAIADWRGKEKAKRERWVRVARAAAKQSRRAFLPEITALQQGIPAISGFGVVLHEQAQDHLYDLDLPEGPLTVVVGPEGGLSDEEVEALQRQGATPVRLGEEILRTSSAGAAACVWIRGFEKRSGS